MYITQTDSSGLSYPISGKMWFWPNSKKYLASFFSAGSLSY